LSALQVQSKAKKGHPHVLGQERAGVNWPWEKVHKVIIATQTMNMAYDPETPSANAMGTVLEAVTKDQLNTGLKGQIRYRISERNLYAYLFGVNHPITHVMGYFVSILRASRSSKLPHSSSRASYGHGHATGRTEEKRSGRSLSLSAATSASSSSAKLALSSGRRTSWTNPDCISCCRGSARGR